jgi:hypothetical protein
MGRFILAAVAAFLAGSAATSPALAQINTGDMKWSPAPPGLPAGAQLAVLSGDPGKEGMFTIRINVNPNVGIDRLLSEPVKPAPQAAKEGA